MEVISDGDDGIKQCPNWGGLKTEHKGLPPTCNGREVLAMYEPTVCRDTLADAASAIANLVKEPGGILGALKFAEGIGG